MSTSPLVLQVSVGSVLPPTVAVDAARANMAMAVPSALARDTGPRNGTILADYCYPFYYVIVKKDISRF